MSDASSNPNLDISTDSMDTKSQLEEKTMDEASLPAEEKKVSMPPRQRLQGPEAHFQVCAHETDIF